MALTIENKVVDVGSISFGNPEYGLSFVLEFINKGIGIEEVLFYLPGLLAYIIVNWT